jgi:hypothetical protein
MYAVVRPKYTYICTRHTYLLCLQRKTGSEVRWSWTKHVNTHLHCTLYSQHRTSTTLSLYLPPFLSFSSPLYSQHRTSTTLSLYLPPFLSFSSPLYSQHRTSTTHSLYLPPFLSFSLLLICCLLSKCQPVCIPSFISACLPVPVCFYNACLSSSAFLLSACLLVYLRDWWPICLPLFYIV